VIYWDTSAIVRAYRLGKVPSGLTRTHSLAEFYSTLTGAGLRTVHEGRTVTVKFAPHHAAEAARKVFAKLACRDLDREEAWNALDSAAAANEQGRAIYDWLHCQVAKRAKCEQIATLNTAHFARMTTQPLVTPEAALTS
jgi:predicted nucleic acid-binding protein